MDVIFLVFVGAGTGGLFRWLLQTWVAGLVGPFPWGTLVVNLVGGFLAGLFLAKSHLLQPWVGPLLMTGFLGGLTTFSAFSAETIHLFQSGEVAKGLGYAGTSVILSIALCGVGFVAGTR